MSTTTRCVSSTLNVRHIICFLKFSREERVNKQFAELLDRIDIHEIGIREKLKFEVERVKKFQQGVLGIKEKITVGDIDIRNYAKYILREGQDVEKREPLGCLKSKISLVNKSVTLSNPS